MESSDRRLPQAVVLALLFAFVACRGSKPDGDPAGSASAAAQAGRPATTGQAVRGYLIVHYAESRVVRLDKDGKMTWKLEELFYPSDATMLPSGNLLIAEQADGAVREYSPEGDVVWELRDLSRPRSAAPLANGNILIADPTANRVLEVTRGKKVVWQLDGKDLDGGVFLPFRAARLASGNTLVVDNGGRRVIEVNQAKQVVWRLEGSFLDAERLPDGSTLLVRTDPGAKGAGKRDPILPGPVVGKDLTTTRLRYRAIQVDSAGKVLWSLALEDHPYDVDRMADGNTLVAGRSGVCIYDPDGKLVRKVFEHWSYAAQTL